MHSDVSKVNKKIDGSIKHCYKRPLSFSMIIRKYFRAHQARPILSVMNYATITLKSFPDGHIFKMLGHFTHKYI